MAFENPEKAQEYQRQWRLANQEKLRAYREANKSRSRENHRRWVAEHYEEVLAKNRRWAAANREKERERSRQYQSDNREKQNERKRKWRSANPDKVRSQRARSYVANNKKEKAGNRRWKGDNPEKIRVYNHSRRARVVAAPGIFTANDWKALRARSPHCHWCKRPFNTKRRPTHDHVTPLSLGGENSPANSVCACQSCNSSKGARLVNPATLESVLL